MTVIDRKKILQKSQYEFEPERPQQQLDKKHHFFSGIRGRLWVGFATVIGLLFIVNGIILYKISGLEQALKLVITVRFPLHDALNDLVIALDTTKDTIQNSLLNTNTKYNMEWSRSWNIIDFTETKIDKVINLSLLNEKTGEWIQAKSLINQLKIAQFKIINANKSNIPISDKTTVDNLMAQILGILLGPIDQRGQRNDGLIDFQYSSLTNSTENVLQEFHTIRIIMYSLFVVVFTLSIFIVIVTANKILRPLNKAINISKSIAAGERQAKIKVKSQDEVGELLNSLKIMQTSIKSNEEKLAKTETKTRALLDNIVQTAEKYSKHSSTVAAGDLKNRLPIIGDNVMTQLGKDLNVMTESLASITKQITQSCINMVTTLQEVRRSVEMQATGASEQASSINEITASLEEIEKSSMQTKDKAIALGEVANRTREKGQLGLEAVEQSIQGMKMVREKVQAIAQTILELSNQTQQVGEITAVVNTLAQQSKMLALNASIEAAKAGEAGKGFAVVATEVKNLAEQSEQSTAQVQKILEDIRHATEKAVMATEEGTRGVDQGTSLVEQTGEIVRSLSDVIHETTIATQQIEAAIRQEGIGIEQITVGMNEINQVTASFVESVKQTTEAIANLDDIAKSLKENIDIYQT